MWIDYSVGLRLVPALGYRFALIEILDDRHKVDGLGTRLYRYSKMTII